MRETLNVILNECEGSIPVVRKAVRCHQSHRFFTRCHVAVSRFSRTAFLRPFRMTIGRKGVIMGGTLNVILNEREGSVPAVSSFRFPAFSYSILIPAQNDTRRQGVIMRETLNVILSTSEESVAVVRKAGKLSSEVIDSSLCVTVPFSVFPTRHSCLRSE